MRIVTALIVVAAGLFAAPASACDVVTGWVGIPLCGEDAPSLDVPVPDVIGEASSAAADTILEGDGLDLGTVSQRCSAETVNEVIRQQPSAGTLVALGTLVDVTTSTGVACVGKGKGKIRIGFGLGL